MADDAPSSLGDAALMPTLLTSLPLPLKRAVLLHLTAVELVHACLVSRAWDNAIYQDDVLFPVIEAEQVLWARKLRAAKGLTAVLGEELTPLQIKGMPAAYLALGLRTMDKLCGAGKLAGKAASQDETGEEEAQE